jgi:putative aldouronate transport system permease protein
MSIKTSFSRKVFIVINTIILSFITFICLAPMIHLLAISLSSNIYAMAGEVSFWPRGFTTAAYSFLTGKSEFFTALGVSVQRVFLGTIISMVLVVLTAYPLSKEKEHFRMRTVYAWFFAFTMFFSISIVPVFMVISRLGLINTMWALVLPPAMSVWHAVLMLNFFRGLPRELEEAAKIDGAGNMKVMLSIYLPLSLPSLATIFLFTVIGHWNAWFDGFIYMNRASSYPLQTYLAHLVMKADSVGRGTMSAEDLATLANVSDKTIRVAQIFLATVPIMIVYPFLQRFFIKGIVVGSVKG